MDERKWQQEKKTEIKKTKKAGKIKSTDICIAQQWSV